jgi:hypothetical protein
MVYGRVAQLVVVPAAVMVVAVMQCKAMGSTEAVVAAVERPMMACLSMLWRRQWESE